MATATATKRNHEVDVLEPLEQLLKDARELAKTMHPREARYLVDMFYRIQKFRKIAQAQVRALEESGEPHALLEWIYKAMKRIENEIRSELDIYTDSEPSGMGRWAKNIYGIGPVIAAGLLANLDITKAKAASSFWRFAGLDPDAKWFSKVEAKKVVNECMNGKNKVARGVLAAVSERSGRSVDSLESLAKKVGNGRITPESLAKAVSIRPNNQKLKLLMWKVADCFVKFSGRDECYYGKLFLEKKEYYNKKNDSGGFAERAKQILESKGISRNTKAYSYYKQGKLPPAHIQAMAMRWVAKIFLAHYFEEAYRRHYKKDPPAPYPIAVLGHADIIQAPDKRETATR